MGVLAVALGLQAARRLRGGQARAIALAAAAGLFGGLGYLTRPEELLGSAIVCVVLAAAAWRTDRRTRGLQIAAIMATLVTTLVCVLPYVMAIGGLDKVEVRVLLPATLVSELENGDLLSVKVPQLGDSLSQGRGMELSSIGERETGLFPVTVEVAVDPATTMIRAGMQAEVLIDYADVEGLITPLGAIVDPVGGDPKVFVVEGNEVREVPGMKKKPSTSELLDWIRLLVAEDVPAEVLRERNPAKVIPPLHGALIKNEQDMHLFERLAFMARRERG